MAQEIINPIMLMGGVGLFCSALLGIAARFFAVREDPRIAAIAELLPGANCGACSLAGCADYARAIIQDNAAINLCCPGGPKTMNAIAELLGMAPGAFDRKTAIVLCAGGDSVAARKFLYNGIADCAAAALVAGGDKACRYGCLGLGSCARICPTGAIEITADRLAVVHAELCIGCGKCVAVCPKNLIVLVPESRQIHVLCRSRERGPVVKKQCARGCIGCTLCAKAAPTAIKMDGALAVVDYSQPLDDDTLLAKCPQHSIVRRSGIRQEGAA